MGVGVKLGAQPLCVKCELFIKQSSRGNDQETTGYMSPFQGRGPG